METTTNSNVFNQYIKSEEWNQNEKMFLQFLSWMQWEPEYVIDFLREEIELKNKEIKNLYHKNPLGSKNISKLKKEIETYTWALDYWLDFIN